MPRKRIEVEENCKNWVIKGIMEREKDFKIKHDDSGHIVKPKEEQEGTKTITI